MKDLFAIIPRAISKMLLERGASGIDRAVIDALAHHRGDNGEIGVSKSGYVMSAQDVCDYYDGAIDIDSVRRSLSRMVKKGILVRSRRVKRGNAWLTVYAFAPHDEPDDNGEKSRDDDGQPCEMHEPMADLPRVEAFTHGKNAMGPMAKMPHSPISTHKESDTAHPSSYNPRSFETESFSAKKDCAPKYPYPDDSDEVYEYMLGDGAWPDHCDGQQIADRFYRLNSNKNWFVGGQPLYDWHAALAGFVRHVDEDACSLN